MLGEKEIKKFPSEYEVVLAERLQFKNQNSKPRWTRTRAWSPCHISFSGQQGQWAWSFCHISSVWVVQERETWSSCHISTIRVGKSRRHDPLVVSLLSEWCRSRRLDLLPYLVCLSVREQELDPLILSLLPERYRILSRRLDPLVVSLLSAWRRSRRLDLLPYLMYLSV